MPPPPQMAPPHGLGAYMPERQPPQQVLLHYVTPLDVMGVSRCCWGTTAMRLARTTVCTLLVRLFRMVGPIHRHPSDRSSKSTMLW